MSLDGTDTGAAAPVNDGALANTAIDAGNAGGVTDATQAGQGDAQPEKRTMDQDLQSVWDKLHPKRGADGTYAKRDGAADATDPTKTAAKGAQDATTGQPDPKKLPDHPEGAAAETKPIASSIDPPQSWSAEKKALWASVPPDAQAYVAQREAEAHQAITRAGEQIKAFEPIRNVVDQFSEVFQRNQVAPHDGIARMLAMETWLGQDAKAAVVEIAKAYGVLDELRGQASQQPAGAGQAAEGSAGSADPAVSTLQRDLAATRAELSKVTSFLTAQQRQALQDQQARQRDESTALARQIADFAKEEKDGKPMRPHFEAVKKHMAALMTSGAADTLQDAYEQAVFANPTIRTQLLSEQRKQDEDKRTKDLADQAAQARKSASVNVKSGTGKSNSPRTIDDTLSETARRLYAT